MLSAAILLLPIATAETLMQREYGDIDAGLDDGALLCRSLSVFAPLFELCSSCSSCSAVSPLPLRGL